MKKKVARRRIDVNVEELDRIIDGAKSAPLSESDSEKLKSALHALAERLLPRSKTEKTSSVFGDPDNAAQKGSDQRKDPSTGHGREKAVSGCIPQQTQSVPYSSQPDIGVPIPISCG